MPSEPSNEPQTTPETLPAPPLSHLLDDPDFIRAIQGRTLPSAVYGIAMGPLLGDKRKPQARAYARDVIDRMAPRDAAEEMLVAQLLFAHARVMRLTEMANHQSNLESLRVLHEYADRASNTYRRLMLALAEYRRPPRTGDTFAVVKQANIAGQQVVQNYENSTKIATNEQGINPAPANAGDGRSTPADPPSLPADSDRLGCPAIDRTACEAVDALHRPKNS
jgi:hypothetical protein